MPEIANGPVFDKTWFSKRALHKNVQVRGEIATRGQWKGIRKMVNWR
jgi:hypothetical protein